MARREDPVVHIDVLAGGGDGGLLARPLERAELPERADFGGIPGDAPALGHDAEGELENRAFAVDGRTCPKDVDDSAETRPVAESVVTVPPIGHRERQDATRRRSASASCRNVTRQMVCSRSCDPTIQSNC